MLQTIEGRQVYVVEFTEIPELPITDGGDPALKPYAEALDAAIRMGTIEKPGKYGIYVGNAGYGGYWLAFAINE